MVSPAQHARSVPEAPRPPCPWPWRRLPARSAGASSPAALPPLSAQVPLPGAARAALSGPLTAPCACPAQSQPRCPRLASAPDSYPTLGGPPGSATAAHRGDRLGSSGRGIFFFRRGRPRRAAGRKCRSLEPRGEGGPFPASARFDAGWPEGLRDLRETALPRATPGPPPGRQNREGLVPGRWLHLIPHLLGSRWRKACSPTARPSLRPAPPPTSPAGGVAGSGGSGP